jgi:hypothetical protein
VQPLVAPVRNHLTADEVVGLIRDAPTTQFAGGCELLTGLDLMLAEDFTADLAGGSVSRSSHANLHGTATLTIARELPWASAIVRPYITLTDGEDTARFNLGAYFTSTPSRDVSAFPVTYDVQCYDLLSILDDPVGDAYAVAEGAGYLAAVESILVNRGVQEYTIDQQSAAEVLPTDRVWPFADNVTWLTIVNDLLGSIGYAGVWTDWDGAMRCQPYRTPRDRGPEWIYDAEPLTSMLGNRSIGRDYFAAPNRWVFVQSNNTDGAAPVEGAGKYTFVNEFVGDTSVDGRGREITRVVQLDVANHAALVAAAQATIDADMQVPTKIRAETFPNPLHWHYDILHLSDPALGVPAAALSTQWTLPLDGGAMGHEWTLV